MSLKIENRIFEQHRISEIIMWQPINCQTVKQIHKCQSLKIQKEEDPRGSKIQKCCSLKIESQVYNTCRKKDVSRAIYCLITVLNDYCQFVSRTINLKFANRKKKGLKESKNLQTSENWGKSGVQHLQKRDLSWATIIWQPIAIIASQAINQKRRGPRIVRV